MALPKKLKAFNVFQDGDNYRGECSEFELPKLSRKMEEYRSGGMNGPIDIDLGQEKIEVVHTYGGLMRAIYEKYGVTKHDGVQLRFAGAYQAEDQSKPDAVEIVIRGRHKEIDAGSAKPGDDTSFKVTTSCSYYKLTINGATIIEIDFVNMVEIVNGDDLLADLRTAIGL